MYDVKLVTAFINPEMYSKFITAMSQLVVENNLQNNTIHF